MDELKSKLKQYVDEWSKPISVVVALLVAFSLVMSCTYFESLEALQYWYENYGLLYALCNVFSVMPPYISLVVIPAIPFIVLTWRAFEKRQIPILIVSGIISACIVTSQSLVHTHTYGSLFGTWLNGLFTILSFIGIWAFVFLLLRPVFYGIVRFSTNWFSPSDRTDIHGRSDEKDRINEYGLSRLDHEVEGLKEPSFSDKDLKATSDTDENLEKPKGWHLNPYHYLIIFFVFIAFWSIYIVGFAPGYINIDCTKQLAMWEGRIEVSTASPILTTIIYGFLFSIGKAIGGDTVGLFTLVIFQTILLSSICTFEVKVFEKLQAPKWVILLLIMLLAASPVVGEFCVFIAMDVLHACCFTLYVALIILYVKDPEDYARSIPLMTVLILAALLTSLTRLNAYYAVLLSLPFLALFQPGIRNKIRTAIPLIVAIALVPLITQGCLMAMGRTDVSVDSQIKQSTSAATWFTYQQSARYALEHPDDYEDWEYKAIDDYLDMEDLGDRYEYWIVDPVAMGIDSEASREEYTRAWLAQGLRHPLTYLDATGEMTYGWWSIQTSVPYEVEGVRIGQMNLIDGDTGEKLFDFGYWTPYSLRTSVDQFAEIMEQLPFVKYFNQAGFYTWMLIILFALLVFSKNPRYTIIIVPSLMILVTLFFGPRDNTMRYFFDVLLSFPLVLWATVYLSQPSLQRGLKQSRGSK